MGRMKRTCTQKTNIATHKPKSSSKREKTSTTCKSDRKRKSLNNTSKPKKNCNTFKMASSRQAGAVNRKKKNVSATKTHSQQGISKLNEIVYGRRNRKRKCNNEKEGERSKRSRLSSHSTSHHNSRCNLCTQPEPKAFRGKSLTKNNGSNQYRDIIELPCKKSVFEKACDKRQIIESGDPKPKKNCNTFKRTSSRQAFTMKRKLKKSSATKTHSQQEISKINVIVDGCKNRKRKCNNKKEGERSKRSRLSSHSASHHNSRCNLCTQPEPNAPRGKSSRKNNGSNQYQAVIELPCKKSVFEKACNLRRTIESGDLLPASLQPLLNESVANKYNINELVATVKESKCKWQETEKRMLELDRSIRAELCINKANPEKCLPLLDELSSLEIDTLMLKKNPRLVPTVQRLCQFVGSRGVGDFTEEEKTTYLDSASQIRRKSKELFQNYQKLFGIEGGQPFKQVFKEKVQQYQETKNNKFLRELCQRVNKGFKKNQISRPLKKRVSGNTK